MHRAREIGRQRCELGSAPAAYARAHSQSQARSDTCKYTEMQQTQLVSHTSTANICSSHRARARHTLRHTTHRNVWALWVSQCEHHTCAQFLNCTLFFLCLTNFLLFPSRCLSKQTHIYPLCTHAHSRVHACNCNTPTRYSVVDRSRGVGTGARSSSSGSVDCTKHEVNRQGCVKNS